MKNATIPLDNPLTISGASITTLSMREPTMAEEEDAMSMAVDLGRGTVPLTTEMCMYALLCNISYDAVRGMKSADYQKLRDAYQRFTRPTGTSRPEPGTPDGNSEPSDAAS